MSKVTSEKLIELVQKSQLATPQALEKAVEAIRAENGGKLPEDPWPGQSSSTSQRGHALALRKTSPRQVQGLLSRQAQIAGPSRQRWYEQRVPG